MTELVSSDEPEPEADASVPQGVLASATFRLWLLALAVAALAGLAACWWLPASASGRGWALKLGLLAAGFTVAEMFPVHLEIRRHTWSTTLTELPLVAGLVFCAPVAVVLAQGFGCLVAWGVIRRQAVHKLAFNVSTAALEAALAVSAYHLLAGARPVVNPVVWGALFAAVVIEQAVSSIAVFGAITFLSGSPPKGVLQEFLVSGMASSTATVLAVSGAMVVHVQPYATGLLAVIAAVLVLGYHELASVRRRYASLQLLHGFTQSMQQSKRSSSIIEDLLRMTRDLLGAEVAEIVLRDEQGFLNRNVLGADGFRREESDRPTSWAAMEGSSAGFLAGHRTSDAGHKTWLRSQGWTDGMVAPLIRNGQLMGTIAVGNHQGEVASFDTENLKLFETLAGHAAVSLENHSLIDQLQWEATHDTLTGLGNRRDFYRNLAVGLRERQAGSKLAVALVDLDSFKEVNDTFGHHTGDTLLQWLGQRFKDGLPSGVTAARLGGDEFAFFVSYEGSAADARDIVEGILQPLWDEAFVIGEVDVVLGASTGVSVAPDHAEDPVTLLQRADVAMYVAKEDHNRVALYSTERDTYTPRRVGLASALRSAIENDELMLLFQPKLDLSSGSVTGAEALVRWQHPNEGLLLPDQFIPLAERTGLIVPLADVVMDKALAQCAKWHQRLPGLGVAVNVSVASLASDHFLEAVADMLRRHRMPPQCLTLEMTETQIMQDERRHAAVLQALADLGVKVSVDDFGTGYSSFTYLTRLPVDQVKIDKSFVGMMDISPNDGAIVRSVIELGRELGIEVVAEGVETRAKLETLRQLGCMVGQGYYIGAPMSSSEFLTLAMEWKLEQDARPRLPATVTALNRRAM